MKVSVLAMLAVAALATASPPCDSHTDLDLSTTKKHCLLPCHPKRPKCPPGFRPRRVSWRCCRRRRFQPEADDEFDEIDEFDELD
jgi:hypothetical protein